LELSLDKNKAKDKAKNINIFKNPQLILKIALSLKRDVVAFLHL